MSCYCEDKMFVASGKPEGRPAGALHVIQRAAGAGAALAQEFIRRLCLHFLPPRFVKIRHYGLLANRGRQERLARARGLLGTEPLIGEAPLPLQLKEPATRSLPVCPHCGCAALILIQVFPPLRRVRPVPVSDTS